MINSDEFYKVIENSFIMFPMTRPDYVDKHLYYKIERDPFPLYSISTSNKIKITMSTFTCTSRISPNRDKISIIHGFKKVVCI